MLARAPLDERTNLGQKKRLKKPPVIDAPKIKNVHFPSSTDARRLSRSLLASTAPRSPTTVRVPIFGGGVASRPATTPACPPPLPRRSEDGVAGQGCRAGKGGAQPLPRLHVVMHQHTVRLTNDYMNRSFFVLET